MKVIFQGCGQVTRTLSDENAHVSIPCQITMPPSVVHTPLEEK